MQIAVIEFPRHVCGLSDANSGEFDETCAHKLIDFMPDQSESVDKGGTLWLGASPCKITPGSRLAACYNTEKVWERHRYRYECSNHYRDLMPRQGLLVSVTFPDGHIVEAAELPANDFYVGVRFHSESKSRPNRAHPLFLGFIAAALKYPAWPGSMYSQKTIRRERRTPFSSYFNFSQRKLHAKLRLPFSF